MHSDHVQKPLDLDLHCLLERIYPESEYDKEMPQSQTADQPNGTAR